MKPIVICYPANINKEVEAINALFENGLEILHVRKPAYREEKLSKWIEAIDSKFHCKMTVHNHLSLVKKMNLRGVHFTTFNRHLIDDYSHSSYPKSISTHSMSELTNLSDNFEYAFLSPVFKSISKANYNPSISHKVLSEYLLKKHNVSVLALGGIDTKNAVEAKKIGFDGVVLHGYLWAQFERDGDVDALVKRFNDINQKW